MDMRLWLGDVEITGGAPYEVEVPFVVEDVMAEWERDLLEAEHARSHGAVWLGDYRR